MKKLLSVVLTVCMLLTVTPSNAINTTSNSAVAHILNGAAIWGDVVDDIVYVITAYDDGRIHMATTDLKDETNAVYELNTFAQPTRSITDYNSKAYWQDVLIFCQSQIFNAKPVSIYESSTLGIPRNTNRELFDMMSSIYGQPYTQKILKTDTTSYPGYKIVVKENLDINISYRDNSLYTKGMAVGTLATWMLSTVPGLQGLAVVAIISGICTAAGIMDAAATLFSSDGSIDTYYCNAVRQRYTAVNNSEGPYSDAYKGDYLWGFDDKNSTRKPALKTDLISYSPSQSYYQDGQYRYLIADAYNNYR